MENQPENALKALKVAACDYGGRMGLFGVEAKVTATSIERAEAQLKTAALAYFEQVVRTQSAE